MLNYVAASPSMYAAPRMQFLRNFVSHVSRHPNDFPPVDGDDTITLCPAQEQCNSPTKGYVQALAELRSTSSLADKPVLSVYCVDTGYHKDVSCRGDSQSVKLTTIRLVDGDGSQIHARLDIRITEVGRQLKRGDIVRLDLFTELRYRVSKGSPRMPALFIINLSRVGYSSLPDEAIKPMLACATSLPGEEDDEFDPPAEQFVIDPRIHDQPVCTESKPHCAVYGIRFVKCVCEVMPVNKRNLSAIKEDCYFAIDDLDSMSNSHKRNMLYWWYATNVFSISGKGTRGQLPLCLEYAIRKEHPNPGGVPYKGYRNRYKTNKRKST